MSAIGNYLYGFTDTQVSVEAGLRGLADAPVRLLAFRDVAAVVSDHPVQKLIPLRSNLEPHHRIVGHLSSQGTLVPAAFGHISESEQELLSVLSENYLPLRRELDRLAYKTEMGLKLLWAVDNIFQYLVSFDRDLREMRNRVFRKPRPSLDEKLQLGAFFEARLNRERERLSAVLFEAMQSVTCEQVTNPPRDEKVVCDCAMLIERGRLQEFVDTLHRACTQFDSNFTLDYSGPRPPYSFVRLRLEAAEARAA